jgi:hypothetical protein
MIPLYQAIGKIVLKTANFNSLPEKEQKLLIVKQYCNELENYIWSEKVKDVVVNNVGRLLELNLDTTKKVCYFSQGTELIPEKKDELLVFANYAPNDPSIYAAHISLKPLLQFELYNYVESNFKKIPWKEETRGKQFLNYLKDIQETFFRMENNIISLKYDKLKEDQQKDFPDPENIPELKDKLNEKKDYNKAFQKYLKKYLSATIKDFVTDRQAYSLKIDGKFLHQTDYSDCYIDVLYYYLFERNYLDNTKQGYCHICGNESTLPKDTAIKQKFFGTTNPLYFDKVDRNSTHNAFSMCQKCNQQVLVGIQYASIKLKTTLLGLQTIVLPEIKFEIDNDEELIDPKNLNMATKLLERIPLDQKRDDINTLNTLLRRLKEFTLLFYSKPSPTSQEFIINGMIKNINLKELITKTEHLNLMIQDYKLGSLYGHYAVLSFEGLRYLILPSKESHPGLNQYDYTVLNKNIISILGTYIYKRKFRYYDLICMFADIYNRKNNNLKTENKYFLNITPFLMTLYLDHLIKFNQLEGVSIMENRNLISKLQDEKITAYFNTHSQIYENNFYAQGLFILGMYIAAIETEQRKKDIKSTLINRLNLRGIPVQKVKSLMAMVDEMGKVWNKYYDSITENYYRECMQGIENSSLSPEEIVFHILSGRAYSNYLGAKYKLEHPDKTEKNQEEQNDQQ